MAIELQSGMSAMDQLKAIDSMARSSSGKIAGNIGLVDGHVVKFNTHWSERLFSRTTDQMRDASNAMRDTLRGLVGQIFGRNQEKIAQLNALIDGNGDRSLLDRAVVARVIDEVAASEGGAVKSAAEDVAQLSSKGRSTTFAAVRGEVDVLNTAKQERQAICERLRGVAEPLVERMKDRMVPPKDHEARAQATFQSWLASGLANFATTVQKDRLDFNEDAWQIRSNVEQVVRVAATMSGYRAKEAE